jgi:DNA-binding transcriptional regulator YdaS (Cro superfamily)
MTNQRQLNGINEAVIRAGSQTKLADLLGVKKQTVQSWVTRGYVSKGKIEGIEKLYGIPIERLCNPKFLEPQKDDSEG